MISILPEERWKEYGGAVLFSCSSEDLEKEKHMEYMCVHWITFYWLELGPRNNMRFWKIHFSS